MIDRLRCALRALTRAPGNEEELHRLMESCFDQSGILYEREVRTATGPVDFAIGDLAVEVKVGGSALAIARQLIRYGQEARFTAVALVTTKPIRLPIEWIESPTGNKPIYVIDLWRQFL